MLVCRGKNNSLCRTINTSVVTNICGFEYHSFHSPELQFSVCRIMYKTVCVKKEEARTGVQDDRKRKWPGLITSLEVYKISMAIAVIGDNILLAVLLVNPVM